VRRWGTTLKVRTGLFLLCTVLTLISPSRWTVLPWLALVAVAAALSEIVASRPGGVLAGPAIESVVCVVAVLQSGPHDSPIFPLLLGPSFAVGVSVGASGAVLTSALGALTLVAAGIGGHHGSDYTAAAATWATLAAASGAGGTAIRTVRARAEGVEPSYLAAYRLLAQLRPVARQLSVGLDPVTVAEGLLQALQQVEHFDRGAVLVSGDTTRLSRLATLGGSGAPWGAAVDDDSPFSAAWVSQRPQRIGRRLDGGPGSGLVLPLTIGLRTFGLIGLETSTERAFLRPEDAMSAVVDEAALRLETALLFDEVRELATAEERRRLAREIHDGIAQELSYLGYVVDDVSATARAGDEDELDEKFRALRFEISRIVGELRMSIFDLRRDVGEHGGLGAALSEYVRSVGRQSGLTVHLSLSETTERLPAETEAELLRIAQEAVTNARRHADADNLWVSLEVDPPAALLRIEDDGRGLGTPRPDSVGLAIMRERAMRLRTTVRVSPRSPSGTTVEIQLPLVEDRRPLTPGPRSRTDEHHGSARR
jgi:signal transduction histidine kinase